MESIKLTKRNVSTIAKVAGIALEHIPMTFSSSDLTPGRKVFFPIPMKQRPKDMTDFLYVYAESKLSGLPNDTISGFTEKDVTDESGVYLFKKDGNFIGGCTYSLSEFLEEIITDPSLRNRIIYRINEMRRMVHLDDTFLDLANTEWAANKTKSFQLHRLH